MRRTLASVLSGVAALSFAIPALAQDSIGDATRVERAVTGDFGGAARPILRGGAVFPNETIATEAASAADLTFRDETSIAIGPLARVLLDRFVYNPDGTARRSVLTAARGALRWTSGRSRANAYQIRTPLAAIGVRGTQFDLLVEPDRETVILRDGSLRVCLAGTDRCRPMVTPGEVLLITPGLITVASQSAPSATEFADGCLTGAEAACTIDPSGARIVALPQARQFAFTGLRVGVSTTIDTSSKSTEISGSQGLLDAIGLGSVPRSQTVDRTRVGFGVEIGYDLKLGPVIVGIGTELAANPFGKDVAERFDSPGRGPVTTITRDNLRHQASVKGRLGFALTDGLMFYGHAGVSVGHVRQMLIINNLSGQTIGQPASYRLTRDDLRVGYVFGAGAEVMITPNIGASIEYSRYDFGSTSRFVPERSGIPGEFAQVKTRLTGDVVKTGLTYRF
jgi:opacity protein-like surface antigen